MKKSFERLAVFIFGVVFVAILLGVAIAIPEPTRFQYTSFRIVLALACAGVGAFIPGFVEVQVSNFLRAGGAIAVFVIVYFFSPAQLVVEPPPISGVVLPPDQYPAEAIIQEHPANDQLEAPSAIPAHEVTFSYRNATEEDLKLFVFDFWKQHHAETDPFATQVFWQAWPFPGDNNYRTYGDFTNTNGWFAFAVGRSRPDGESLEAFFLKTTNLFYSRNPSLTVRQSTDRRQPFAATFSERGVGE